MNFEAEHHETILAYFYMKGFGTNKDYRECLQWCNKGCEKKDIYAYYELAFCYRDSLAVSGGVLKAKRELAIMYMDGMVIVIFDGIGIEKNLVEALKYYKICWKNEKSNAIRRIPLIEKML
ncbi:19137_t:CDS:2, partial [Gigaspora rosea]